MCGVSSIDPISARARVHGGDQLKIGREGHAGSGPRDRDLTIFERLPQSLERLSGELWEFVQKKNPTVREADLARFGNAAATDQTGIGNLEVRVAKRCDPDQSFGHFSGGGMDPCDLERLTGGQRWAQSDGATGEHGFTRSGRANQKQVVCPGHGDLERPFRLNLTLDVLQFERHNLVILERNHFGGLEFAAACEVCHSLL